MTVIRRATDGGAPLAPATRTARLRRVGRWLARIVLAVALVVGFACSVLPQGRTAVRAALILPALVTGEQPAPLRLVGGEVHHTTRTLDARGGRLFLDIYAPADGTPPVPGSREGVVLIPGVGDNRQEPQLLNLAESLARSGLVVASMTTDQLLNYTLIPDDADAVALACLTLAQEPGVGADRVGIVGFSAGGALAVRAAGDPRIRDSLAFITLFGGYYDAESLLAEFGRRALRVNGHDQAWSPELVPLQVLANTIGTTLPFGEATILEAAFSTADAQLAPDQMAALSPPALAAYHLLKGDQPDRAEANITALSPPMRDLLGRLSPSAALAAVRAPIYLLHDQADQYVPFTQSRAFAAALVSAGHPHEYAEFSIFQHVEVRGGLPVGTIASEAWRLYRVVYALLLPSA